MKIFNISKGVVVAVAVVIVVGVGAAFFFSQSSPTLASTTSQYASAFLQNLSTGDTTSEQCASAARSLENTLAANTSSKSSEDVQDSAYLYNKHRCIALVAGSADSTGGYWAIVDATTQSELYQCDVTSCTSTVLTPPSYLGADAVFEALKAAGGQ